MALGALLGVPTLVSTTAGYQDVSLDTRESPSGLSIINDTIAANGKLAISLMSYTYDAQNSEPPLDGDYARIYMYYGEYGASRTPKLTVRDDGSGGSVVQYSVSSITAGNSDDAVLQITDYSAGTAWSSLVGDETTSSTTRYDTYSAANGIYSLRITGRGAQIVRVIARSVFEFDTSGIPDTFVAAEGEFEFYMDNTGTYDSGIVVAVQATTLEGTTADYGNCFVADTVAATDNATFFGANF